MSCHYGPSAWLHQPELDLLASPCPAHHYHWHSWYILEIIFNYFSNCNVNAKHIFVVLVPLVGESGYIWKQDRSRFCSKTLDLHKNWHPLPIWVREGHKKGDPIFFWTCAQYLRLSALNRIFRLDFLQIWTILGKNQGQLIMSINPNGTASCWDLWFYPLPLGKKFESWNFLESNLQVSHILTNVRGWI